MHDHDWTPEQIKAAQKVLAKHEQTEFCCNADRGPCVFDGLPRDQNKCCANTCKVCAPGPYDGPRKPIWPCDPVVLAEALVGDPRCGECRLGLGVHDPRDPGCDHQDHQCGVDYDPRCDGCRVAYRDAGRSL